MKLKPKSDVFIIHNSILIAVFLGAFVLWNCGGEGIFSVFGGALQPVWKFDPWDIFIFEITALMSAGFQTFIFVVACGSVNAIGVHINKIQSK